MDYIPFAREIGSVFQINNGRGGNTGSNMKLNSTVMGILKTLYWIFAIVLVGYTCYYVYNVMERPVAGILLFLGGVMAAYFYYVKWFIITAKNPAWPPYQTVCPDYLTPVAPGYTQTVNPTTGAVSMQAPADASLRCVDFVGVSTNGLLKRANPATIKTQLNMDNYAMKIDPKATVEDLRAKVGQYGLSWLSLLGETTPSS